MTEPEKRCCTCHRDLPLFHFNKRVKAPDGLQSRCRECSREWYQKNRARHIANTAANRAATRKKMRRQLVEYLLDHPCVDCGNPDLRVLDLDHLEGTEKIDCISRLMQSGVWKRVAEELEKCEVRCANCHRIKTARDFDTYKHRAASLIDDETARLAGARLAALFPGAA